MANKISPGQPLHQQLLPTLFPSVHPSAASFSSFAPPSPFIRLPSPFSVRRPAQRQKKQKKSPARAEPSFKYVPLTATC